MIEKGFVEVVDFISIAEHNHLIIEKPKQTQELDEKVENREKIKPNSVAPVEKDNEFSELESIPEMMNSQRGLITQNIFDSKNKDSTESINIPSWSFQPDSEDDSSYHRNEAAKTRANAWRSRKESFNFKSRINKQDPIIIGSKYSLYKLLNRLKWIFQEILKDIK